jgi:hypothetical protein
MNDIMLLAGRGSSFKDCTDLVIKASITGRRGDAPRTFSATLSDSESHGRLNANCGEGQSILFYLNGDEIFRGLLMTDGRNNSRKLSLKAYDNCIYLCNNKGSFSYKKKTATYIFKDCLKKLGLKLGSAVDTGHKISELVKKNTTYWDVIQDALSQTYKSTGTRYYVYSSKGKIYLKKRQEQSSMPVLDLTSNVQTYDMTRSIYNTRTRLTLKTSKGKKKGSSVNSALEKKIGKFRDIETVDEDITKTEIKQRIKAFELETSIVDQELKVKATGNMKCVSGACAYVDISQIDTKRVMYIEEDTHTFENGHHDMELKLSYESTSKNTSSGSGSYKVTAKGGLRLRSGPSGKILKTIPYGATVSSDGKKSGNWIHVKYKGTWGYAYKSWLKST